MKPVEIYTSSLCGFCHAAKRLLNKKGVKYKEISVDGDRALRAKMTKRAQGQTSVPQIFVGKEHIGGCDDLHDLERNGALDLMLEG
ncbi:glutaredoxin 3 [Halocynthiibacter styelae]|uniref:Glutaredoxin n=1 Tax=Halocynthiibacter styelae TaxID=2761955 RepID=A0A8J7IER7_9RHOB|nr:glutaredoxin 3 [Paenihalocynthiibacter styelae]MBI1493962.1 glutaredoxin 3 [Paenihalocynthiibacter styelae]